jgi:hypothetical protein
MGWPRRSRSAPSVCTKRSRRARPDRNFISAEPLLADLGPDLDLSGISQIIAGGENGWHLRDAVIRTRRGMADPPLGKPTAIEGWTPRPDRIDCMRHLRDFCQAQGTAYFLKQWGGIIPGSAGRILQGEWSEQPRVLGDNGRWHDRRGSVKRVHPPRSLVNTYSAASSYWRRHDGNARSSEPRSGCVDGEPSFSPRDVHHAGFAINPVPAECVQSRKPLARACRYRSAADHDGRPAGWWVFLHALPKKMFGMAK